MPCILICIQCNFYTLIVNLWGHNGRTAVIVIPDVFVEILDTGMTQIQKIREKKNNQIKVPFTCLHEVYNMNLTYMIDALFV